MVRFAQNTVEEVPIKTCLLIVSFMKIAARKLLIFHKFNY